MKKIFSIILSVLTLSAFAHTNQSVYKDGKLQDKEFWGKFKASEIKADSILFDHYVWLSFENGGVEIANPYPKDSMSIVVDGSDITIDSYMTAHDVKYVLSGIGEKNVTFSALKKQTIVLDGVNLISNNCNPVLNITTGKGTDIILKDGSNSVIENVSAEDGLAAIKSKGQLVFKGTGSLTVDAKSSHGIQSSDYIVVENGQIIIKSVGDGIHVNDYYEQNGGKVFIDAQADGVDVGEGHFVMNGGDLSVIATSNGAKGIKSEIGVKSDGFTPKGTGEVLVNGGKIDIRMAGKGARGIKADGDITITNGEVLVLMEGESLIENCEITNTCGVKSSNNFKISGGELSVICNSTANSSRAIQADIDASFLGGKTFVNVSANDKVDRGSCDKNVCDPKNPRAIQADSKIEVSTLGETKFFITIPSDKNKSDEYKVKPFKTDGNIILNKTSLVFGEEEDFETVDELYEGLSRIPGDWKYKELVK